MRLRILNEDQIDIGNILRAILLKAVEGLEEYTVKIERSEPQSLRVSSLFGRSPDWVRASLEYGKGLPITSIVWSSDQQDIIRIEKDYANRYRVDLRDPTSIDELVAELKKEVAIRRAKFGI